MQINQLNGNNNEQDIILKQQQLTIEQQQATISQLERRLATIETKEYEREKEQYVIKNIKRDKINVFLYIGFIFIVSVLWFVNHLYSDTLSVIWASVIGFALILFS